MCSEYCIQVRGISIVIVSYNCMYLMQKCLESIRKHCNPKAYEIVGVDNASKDGIREWLQQQSDIKLILCDENAGFPMGCNIGVQYAESVNDIVTKNYYYMLEKYQCDIISNAESNRDALAWIEDSLLTEMKVLEINAGTGNTLARIKYICPQAEVYGVEENEKLISYGVKSIPIVNTDWRKVGILFEKGYFDFIILTRIREEEYTEVTEYFKQYLKENGRFI